MDTNKEKPILFSGPMVRAILAGHKTQTRRIVKEYYTTHQIDLFNHKMQSGIVCPYGSAGDRLWVRETWGLDAYTGDLQLTIKYRAGGGDYVTDRNGSDEWVPVYQKYIDGCGLDDKWDRWRPSIHMPRWASRITLEITGVRIESLQDITEHDALAEGALHWWGNLSPAEQERVYCGGGGPIGAFHALWDSINIDRAPWESSPWVWVVEFKMVNP